MNAIGYQGIFEAAGHKLNDIGGVMLWKLNSAFPSVVWQVYDWFLQPNAGYYFMQNACEQNHIQLNISNLKVTTLNRTYKSLANVTAHVEVFNLDSKSIYSEEAIFNLGPTEVKETTDLTSVLQKEKGVVFVVLHLKNSAGKVISHNVYWLAGDADYKTLNSMQKTSVQAKLSAVQKEKSQNSWTIQITNTTTKIAFFIRPQLMLDGEELLPSYWTSNYFTLAPNETTTVSVGCPLAKLNGKTPLIKISGWNVDQQELILK